MKSCGRGGTNETVYSEEEQWKAVDTAEAMNPDTVRKQRWKM
jgi:hypothetical protein